MQSAGRSAEQKRHAHVGDPARKTGTLPTETPLLEEDRIALFADARNVAILSSAVGARSSPDDYLKAHLDRLTTGDYFATIAYVERNEVHETALQGIRHTVRDARRVATVLGFGLRFLHSTGQAYEGGPNSGVFMQITCDDAPDLPALAGSTHSAS